MDAPRGDGIEVRVRFCSVCHSDVHLLDGDWGELERPFVPGHEIVGETEDGRMVGIGWQAGACGTCVACTSQRAHLCTGGKQRTCVGRTGGFADRVRVDPAFAFELPSGLDPREAAPLLCAGLTTFSPLERFPAKRVGVVGIGGLGHLAVRFASAMGAEVLAFDPDLGKRALANELGASALHDKPAGEVDLLLVTTHAALDWGAWLGILALEGTMCLIGVPDSPISIPLAPLQDEQKSITGSVIGSPETMKRMLAFAADKGITSMNEHLPMSRANDAIERIRSGQARFRVVLDQE